MEPRGVHCLLELHGCPRELLVDEAFVRAAVAEACEAAGATLLQLASHRFEPQGATVIALLAESHLSVHTWPEFDYAAVDVFTCGDTTDPEAACEVLAAKLEATRRELRRVERPGTQA